MRNRYLTVCVLVSAAAWILAGDARAQGSAATDRAALAALYHATNGPNWIYDTNWLSDAPLADWVGVTTDDSGRVTGLALPGNGLSGPIPAALLDLARLEQLDLGSRWDRFAREYVFNSLEGPIRRDLPRLANLRQLDVDGNLLSGPIPVELASLTALERLSLAGNRLNGPIPAELANLADLGALYLNANQLDGAIPAELGSLAGLRVLSLAGNRLSGSVPAELGNLANLLFLSLGSNRLSGPIPVELARLARLRSLFLAGNRLSGPIPPELGQLAGLQSLSLSGNGLTGSIPPELGRLTNLGSLFLSFNDLGGPIPPELGRLANLQFLDLFYNQLSGPIPTELANLSRLVYLDLDDNRLSGPIPPELGRLTGLQSLFLSRNHFSGPIPPELGGLARLGALFLGGNQLSGPIPRELGNLANLFVLDLESNQLSGSIPEELAGLASLFAMSVSFNEMLTGPLPEGFQDLRLLTMALLGTDVCVPEDAAFRAWSSTIDFKSSGRTCGTPAPEMSVVDVAVFYTPAARRAYGRLYRDATAAIQAEIDLWIAETNQAYMQSGVNQRVALAAREEVLYAEADDEEGGSIEDLIRLANPADGHLDIAHTVRERVGADLIHFMSGREDPDVCGVAFFPASLLPQEFIASGLTHQLCGSDTFAHELGHNMGLQHDRYVTCTPECPNWPYPHGHGYSNLRSTGPGASASAGWSTIMAYSSRCYDTNLDCSRLLRFSNPRQAWRGDPLGVAGNERTSSASGPADAARALNQMRHSIAAYRQRPGRPGDWDEQLEWYRGTWTAFTDAALPNASASDAGASVVGDAFTDRPLDAGTTPVRAVHLRELRARVAALRTQADLSAVAWTDATLAAGGTPVKRVHLTELRAALDAVYDAEGRSRPSYTDATVTAGATAVKAVHITELRAAITALEQQ